ncbi:hypothetical protein KR222_006220 [Zaprionus bogoriensis]|nr:hypothetical protein KR222_006220 [Zaprionus bogoriensis]
MNKYISFAIFTIFWALFAIVGCIIALFFRERGIIRCCVLVSAFCCWLLWLVAFLMQLNPLSGPRCNQKIVYGMAAYWPESHIYDDL